MLLSASNLVCAENAVDPMALVNWVAETQKSAPYVEPGRDFLKGGFEAFKRSHRATGSEDLADLTKRFRRLGFEVENITPLMLSQPGAVRATAFAVTEGTRKAGRGAYLFYPRHPGASMAYFPRLPNDTGWHTFIAELHEQAIFRMLAWNTVPATQQVKGRAFPADTRRLIASYPATAAAALAAAHPERGSLVVFDVMPDRGFHAGLVDLDVVVSSGRQLTPFAESLKACLAASTAFGVSSAPDEVSPGASDEGGLKAAFERHARKPLRFATVTFRESALPRLMTREGLSNLAYCLVDFNGAGLAEGGQRE